MYLPIDKSNVKRVPHDFKPGDMVLIEQQHMFESPKAKTPNP